MPQLDSKENYLYGMMFSLVRDNLKIFEKCRHKKPGIWDKTRGAAREVKIEDILRKILNRKLDNHPNEREWGKLLIADLTFIAEDNDIWSDVDAEQVNYVIQMAAKFT